RGMCYVEVKRFITAIPRPPRSPLFPYTTLFRSQVGKELVKMKVKHAAIYLDSFQNDLIDAENAAYLAAEGISMGSYRFDDYKTSDRKSTRLNSSHVKTSYAVFCLKKKTKVSTGQ